MIIKLIEIIKEKKRSLFYVFLILVAILFPLTTYPRIYGVDAFHYMWMTNALREGALFSNKTWLISPLSYFGYYPLSFTPIGVPLFLAFLMSFLEFVSFGIFGITESILALNIILIILICKSSRSLGEKLFEEEWSRFIFVAANLFSPNIISDITMTVSTRIIITIIMMGLLNINLKTISNYKNDLNILKVILVFVIFLFVGALAHRLWIITIITIVFMIFTLIIQRSKKLKRFIIFLIIPLSILVFFIGLNFFVVDPRKISSPFIDNSSLIGVCINLSLHFALQAGLLLLFFPIGVLLTLYKVANFLIKPGNPKNDKSTKKYLNRFYLLLFIVPLLFMAPSFYSIVIFLPILISFSVEGLIFVKKTISSFSKNLSCFFPPVFLIFAIGYSLLYVQLIFRINLWYMFLLLSFVLFFYLFFFIINLYNAKIQSKISSINFNNYKLKQLEMFILIVSVIIFSTTTVTGRWRSLDSNTYPWENRYLSGEEQEIINFFQDEDISGLIFTNVPELGNRISGVSFLPVFNLLEYHKGETGIEFVPIATPSGKALYYDFINPKEVYKYTLFSISYFSSLNFFWYNKSNPIRTFSETILQLNISLESDLNLLQYEYNVQYIITGNENILLAGQFCRDYNLITSLPTVFNPVFSTQCFFVWKLY